MHLASLKSFAQTTGEDKLGPLSERAVSEAGALEEELASARRAAKAALTYFAVNAPTPKDVDTKGLDLLGILGGFLDAFERTAQEMLANPKLAALCHGDSGSAELGGSGAAAPAEAVPEPHRTAQQRRSSPGDHELHCDQDHVPVSSGGSAAES